MNIENMMISGDSSPLSVTELQWLRFSRLSLREKVRIKERGRPTPDLQIVQEGHSHGKKFIISFNRSIYDDKNWLCGSDVKNALLCFPCLLFDSGRGRFGNQGFTNLSTCCNKKT